MKNLVLVIFPLLVGPTLPLQRGVQDSLERRILQCLQEKGRQLEINVFEEFGRFENYLISAGYIKDDSGSSYYEVYKQIVNEGDFKLYRDYSNNNKLDSLKGEPFGSCYYQFRSKKVFKKSNSKYKELTLEFEHARPDYSAEYNPLKVAASIYLRVLEPEDFENPIFKYSALYYLYFTAYDLAWKD